MAVHQEYRPLSGDEEKNGEEIDLGAREVTAQGTPRSSVAIYVAALMFSLCLNCILAVDNARIRRMSKDHGRSKYSGITFDTVVPFRSYNEYWNPNVSDEVSNAAWDAIDTNPMAISLHNDFAKQVGLGPSTCFPWDTERSIYYVKGFHDLHCLKLIRKAIVSKHSHANNQTFNFHHLLHCLDGLRQDIMCTADDTPMPAPVAHHVGDGQLRQCRDWEKLRAWATRPDQHACHQFDDYREATNTLELFGHCPDGSPYRPVMKAYFAYHGHKDPYELKGSEEKVIF
ncbi:hypothetical protein BU23DRAFT_42659 [Bimuria novae-zelandiae CBS 107.79]|uniref:Uncharacterized protein n=1 Tax=Bimuria novae-zelandiae CBS 107.79 TaxID=1447943 RepID=A0A6A5VGL1_9PLEO|nr:hypothetical protein BU23DRAFT_42659 [Bimuria novae-zelandiae CBS 107.79]